MRHPAGGSLAEEHRQLSGDGVVLVGSARHGDDHAIDELVAVRAAAFDREVLRVRSAMRQAEVRFHDLHASSPFLPGFDH